MKNKCKLLILSLIVCFSLIAFGTTDVKAAANEVIGTNWEIHNENVDLEATGVSDGGVGRVSYYAVPEETENGHPDGKIYNSVTIPVTNYDVNCDRVSIKYRTNIVFSEENISLYAKVAEGLSDAGDILDEEIILFAWVPNWNVANGKAADGESYITVDHNNYTKTREVIALIVNFDYLGTVGREKYFEFLGIDFHNKADKPTFVTDPGEPSVSETPTLTSSSTITTTDFGHDVAVSTSETLTYQVRNWNKAIKDSILLEVVPFSGMNLVINAGESEVYNQTFTGTDKVLIEEKIDADELTTLTLTVTGSGTFSVSPIQIVGEAKVTTYSTAHNEYFDLAEEISEGTYQMHFKHNNSGGYAKHIVSVANYREQYDVMAIDINVIEGVSLVGLAFSDGTWLINHWDKDNFLNEGEHKITVSNLGELVPENWDGTLNLYVNPASLETDGYNYISEIKLGIYFIKSSDLATPEVSVPDVSYVFDYDGTTRTVVPTVTPSTLKYEVIYHKGETSSETGATDAGEYTVEVTVLGDRTYKSITVEVPLTINKVNQDAPVASDVTIDYLTGTITYANKLQVSKTDAFADTDLISSGATVTPGATLYVRCSATVNYNATEAITVTVNGKNATPSGVTATSTDTTITVSEVANAEYCLVTGDTAGEWQSSNVFSGLTAETEYTVKVRVKATISNFASDEYSLQVTTSVEVASTEPTVDDPSGCAGCSGMQAYSFIALSFALLALFVIVKVVRNKRYN